MKLFWAVLLVLMAASGAYLALGRGGASSKHAAWIEEMVVPETPRLPGQKDNDESAFFAGNEPVAKAEARAEGPAPKPEAKKPVETAKPADAPSPAAKPAAAKPDAPSAKSAGHAVEYAAEPKIVKNDDGTMTVDEKYPVKGEGTKEKPYEITWEYLVSAQEDYAPRLGKKKLPGRMKVISGKYVKITGFIAFPVMATEPTEMLSMLNQWDGCCIGIPPTPYDAIEVKLKEAASTEDRLTTYGTVQGKLKVEPYLMRDWLVSLYSMEEATMEKAQ